MQLNAVLSLSKLVAQLVEKCVYVKLDAQVNGLMKIWLYVYVNHLKWSEWSKWNLTSLKGERRGPNQANQNKYEN